ncbi:MAG: FkbM family methyltransferase [Ignavibacteria bacterium]|nr:FkbM family methyltransferase [Ignavibacteria bacterium]
MSIRNKIKGSFIYLINGYRVLSNWPAFYTDLFRSFFGLNNKSYLYELRDRTKIKVHSNSLALNHVFYTVFLKGEYDSLEKFKIREEDIIIDIGAHLGFFTIKAAKKACNGTVYAFEPFSMHYELLKENILSNNIKNVKFYNQAITDKTSELSFYYTMHGDPGDTSLFKINPEKKTYEEKVKSISLQDFFNQENIENCNFLKMDCEGAEYSILMKANDSTLAKIQRIAMEWHKFEPDHDPKGLAEFLKENGFNLIEPPSYNEKTGFLFAFR